MSRLIRFQASLSGCVWQRLPYADWSASVWGLLQEVLHG